MSEVSIFVGTVYGNSQSVAESVQEKLSSLGYSAEIYDDPSVDDFKKAESVLIITSTTGQGEFPPNIEFFFADIKDQMPMLNGKPFAVVGLADSSYGDTFAGAGKQAYELMLELQGNPLADLKIVDAMETYDAEEDVLPWIDEVYKPV